MQVWVQAVNEDAALPTGHVLRKEVHEDVNIADDCIRNHQRSTRHLRQVERM